MRAACPISVLASEYDAIVELSAFGGRFELDATTKDMEFLSQLLLGVTLGGAIEVGAASRSRVTVVLPNGQRVSETGYDTPVGCLPLPGWEWWGGKTRYEPYVTEAGG